MPKKDSSAAHMKEDFTPYRQGMEMTQSGMPVSRSFLP